MDRSNSANTPAIWNSAFPPGVEVSTPLLMEIQTDLLGVNLGQEIDQIPQAATQSVHRPAGDQIESAAVRVLNERVELGTLVPALANQVRPRSGISSQRVERAIIL
jgi:hypothetical protein